MTIKWRNSITSRTLLQLGGAVCLIIAVATCVTYYLIFRAAEERGVIHLNQYIGERVGRIDIQCAEITRNLETARDAFIHRYQQSDPPEYLDQWDEYFEHNADGAWRSKREYSNDYEFAPMWAHKDVGPSPDFKRRILVMFEVCQKFLPAWVRSFRSLYGYTSDEMAVIGFDPALAGWIYDQAANYDINHEEFGMSGMPEANPDRTVMWTGTTADVSSGHSLVSVVLPVDLNGRHVMTVAHDMWVDSLIEETSRSQITGLTHVIFRQDGRIIAYPHRSPEIFAGGGKLNMATAGESALSSIYRAVAGRTEPRFSGYDNVSEHYYAVHRVAGPGWFYLSMMPRSVLREQAFHSARWVLWGALASLGFELLVLGLILRRNIEEPVAELVSATRQLASGQSAVTLQSNRPDELGMLSRAFNDMAQSIRERDEALRREKATLEERVAERTNELLETNSNLRKSEDLLARALDRQTELVQLKTNFVSLVSHEFRTPLEIITSSAFNLERYHDRLAPEKQKQLLETIKRAVERMAGMMEQVLFLGRLEPGRVQYNPQPIDLSELCRRVGEEIETSTAQRCPVKLELVGDLAGAVADEAVLRHIFTNLLSNAVKYSADQQEVRFVITREGSEAKIEIIDQGCGIPEADQARLFEAFHRGGNVENTTGTGLGLVIVKRCLEVHGGRVAYASQVDQGTAFCVYLPLFPTP